MVNQTSFDSQDFLELDDKRQLAFRIAEGTINYNEVSNILRSIVKTGWITELFEELTNDINDYFKETQEISYLKKKFLKKLFQMFQMIQVDQGKLLEIILRVVFLKKNRKNY